MWREYWRQGRPEIRWNEGWILDALRITFWFFSKLSVSRVVVYFKEKKYGIGHRKSYQSVDWYVLSWLIAEVSFFILLAIFDATRHNALFWIPLIFIFYRLFDIFQSLVSQYILGGVTGKWNPINIYRSLVLVFIGYLEVTISNAFVALFFKTQFNGIDEWTQAWYYSLRNAATIGSDYSPKTVLGLIIFSAQVIITLLFVTAVVNRIISHIRDA